MSNSFLRGMRQAVNLFPRERKGLIVLPSLSNEEAFKKDLEQVGDDMRFAMKTIENSKDFNKKLDENSKEIGHSAQS